MEKKQLLRWKLGIREWRIWVEEKIEQLISGLNSTDGIVNEITEDLGKLSKLIDTEYPVFTDSANAILGGLSEGDVFKTPAGAISFVTINRVESISTTDETKELSVNDTFDFADTLTVEPDYADDKTITYLSSDESISTVSTEGLITAVSAGEATITASAGDKYCTCVVTVS